MAEGQDRPNARCETAPMPRIGRRPPTRLATLRDVVRHYCELNEERLHADGERVLKRLDLSAQEIDDLVVFLETLSPLPDK